MDKDTRSKFEARARILKAMAHPFVKSRERYSNPMPVAEIPKLCEAKRRRGIKPSDSAEVQYHILDRLVPLPLDRLPQALENRIGGTEENKT